MSFNMLSRSLGFWGNLPELWTAKILLSIQGVDDRFHRAAQDETEG